MKRITNKKWNSGIVEWWNSESKHILPFFHSSILPSFLFIACCLLTFSCRKAGTGGDASLMVYPQHHGNPIINHVGYSDTVFLKYNVDEFPGTKPSDYDAFFVGTPREEFVKIEGLKTGKYFVYAVGYDSTYLARVTGGIPLKIKHSERKDEINLTMPLTE